jgi:hypothetical protein
MKSGGAPLTARGGGDSKSKSLICKKKALQQFKLKKNSKQKEYL